MNVTPLYPSATGTLPLEGLYLRERLQAPLLYSSFVTSLDGRIALARTGRATHEVPKEIANPHDWRLYQELAAQADVLITSARFFRQAQINEAQGALPLGPECADLRQWRIEQGLSEQPDLAIVSTSLGLPLGAVAKAATGRRVRVLTGAQASPARKAGLRKAGIEVIEAGPGEHVEGGPLRRALEALGAKRMYAVAGPQLLYVLLADRVLDRLYLTLSGRLLGGTEFDTLCHGPELEPAPKLRLANLYLDPDTPADAGQLLATYDLVYA
ncbi:MAG: RibD family protein [Gammaproteobacteria bacterium]